MKKLSLYVFLGLMFCNVVFAEVYYCLEEKTVGFDRGENYKVTTFIPQKFVVDINFDLKKIVTNETEIPYMGFNPYISSKCIISKNRIYCINQLGTSFVFNKKSNEFHFSSLYMDNEKTTDDIWLSYGKCSKFE